MSVIREGGERGKGKGNSREKKKEGKPGEIGGKMEMKKAWKMNAVKTCDHTD